MSYASTVLGDSPIAYWRLNETSGTTAADQLSTSPGTYGSGVTLANASLASSLSPCAFFSGAANAVVSIAANSTINLSSGSAITMELWMKPTGLNTFNFPIDKQNGSNAEYCVYYNGIQISDQGSGGWNYALATGTVYHLVISSAGTTSTLYVNGVSFGTKGFTALTLGTQTLYLGNYYTAAYPLTGYLSDVALYTYALSGAQVSAHYNAGTLSDPATYVVLPCAGNIVPSIRPSNWRGWTKKLSGLTVPAFPDSRLNISGV